MLPRSIWTYVSGLTRDAECKLCGVPGLLGLALGISDEILDLLVLLAQGVDATLYLRYAFNLL